MRTIAIAAVLVLALPSTAWAVTLKPPNPDTISRSGTGAPTCTTLTFVTAKTNYRMEVTFIGPLGRKQRIWDRHDVPPGTHGVAYCASDLDATGTANWNVKTFHYASSATPVKKVGQPFTIEP